jgi:ribonucleoside-diphosphate reductase alpha chain
MDCDTTGVEPDFALVKFKKLAGGGYFKIANQSLKPALVALGYDNRQIGDILRYVLGTLDLEVSVPGPNLDDTLGITLAELLRQAGLTDEDLHKVTTALPGVFEISFAFTAWALGDEALKRARMDPNEAKSDPGFNLLKRLGLSQGQIDVLNEVVCGSQTIEGAPHLREEHLPVFDCANTCGRKGKRFIAPQGHIRMMAAAQPFISGAISKTINLPNNASVEDIKSAYRLSWELGLKANALYRDGCKLSQPLSTKSEDASGGGDAAKSDAKSERAAELRLLKGEDDSAGVDSARFEVTHEVLEVVEAVEHGRADESIRTVERMAHRPMRRRLPDTRKSLTHKFNIAGHEGYLTVGLYDDHQPGELFITMAKEGSTIGGLMDSLGTAVSVALQYGVPVESLVKKFTHQRFEPAGMTTNRDIPFAKSLVDYIFRWMGMEFVEGYRDANAPRRSSESNSDAPPVNMARKVAEQDSSMREAAAMTVGMGGERLERKVSSPRPRASMVIIEESTVSIATQRTAASALSVAMLDCQGDAPSCEVCGTITVRNGSCYKCLNCGHSMGCS